MRPKSIVIFDWLFLASLVVSVVNTAVSYSAIVELFATDPTLRATGVPGGPAYVGSHAFSIVISARWRFSLTSCPAHCRRECWSRTNG